MRILSVLSALLGLICLGNANTVLQEIAGIGLLILAAILWIGAGVTQKDTSSALRKRRCPSCKELIMPEAVVCKHCGKDVPPLPKQDTHLADKIAFYSKQTETPPDEQPGKVQTKDKSKRYKELHDMLK